MKLLLDENLSRRVLPFLEHHYPGSRHVVECGLGHKRDEEIWLYAAKHGFVIVSRDADFLDMGFKQSDLTRLIWLGLGNCRNATIVQALTSRRAEIEQAFLVDGVAILELR